jgi:transglutaminase-like putative cysteine protease
VGGRWYTFDATQPVLNGGYVTVGYGRDAADVAVYSQFGPMVYSTAQRIAVQLIE